MLPSLGPTTPTARADSSPSLPEFDVDMKGTKGPAEIAAAPSAKGAPRRSTLLAAAAILGAIGVTLVAASLVRSPEPATTKVATPSAEAPAAPADLARGPGAPATVAAQQASIAVPLAAPTTEPASAPAPPPVVKHDTPPARPWTPPAPAVRPAVGIVAAAQPPAAPRPAVTAASQPKPAANASKNIPIVPDEF